MPPAGGGQVNDDGGAGINPALGVSGADPADADVVGGALTAGKPAVPWAIFRQQTAAGHDQAFVRSFGAGAWTTRAAGTVGGKSSAAPVFPGSLNFDQGQDAEAPAIDFAGAGRTTPWATWYEATSAFAADQVFASRFDNSGDTNQGKWIFAGQSRGLGTGTIPVPSLNIHPGEDAENPSIAGGSTADPAKPGPWIAWQETGASAPGAGRQQIFVVRSLGPGMANCDGVAPLGVGVAGHVPAIGGFCWQQTGVERLGADPSLDVDRARDAVEPDIAFTGANDATPWVVWYEQNAGGAGLHANDMVFAAKATAPGALPPTGTVDGGFDWTAVGRGGTGVLDASVGGGPCAADATAEAGCSLNADANQDAADPRIAAGTMDPATRTVPWVAWDEVRAGVHQVLVARLVGGRFALVNGNAPVSTGSGDATRPDITFSGNTPYVSWRENVGGGVEKAFYGHFVNAAAPAFVLDSSEATLTPTAQADVREPISSACTATPFDGDGAACQGGAVGTPFSLFTSGTPTRALLSQAYDVGVPATGGPSGVTTSGAVLNGAVDPQGAGALVSFQFGGTAAYGQATAARPIGPADGATAFAAQLGGLPAGATIHYRAVASTDFGVKLGADQTLTTASTTTPPRKDTKAPSITLTFARTTLTKLLKSGKLKVKLTVGEAARLRLSLSTRVRVRVKVRHGHRISVRVKVKTVVLGKDLTLRLTRAGTRTLTLTLGRTGKATLRKLRSAKLTVTVTAVGTAGNRAVKRASLTLKR